MLAISDSLPRTVDDHRGLSDGVSALRAASGTTGGLYTPWRYTEDGAGEMDLLGIDPDLPPDIGVVGRCSWGCNETRRLLAEIGGPGR